MEVLAGDWIFKIAKLQMLWAGNWPLVHHWSRRRQFYYKLYSYFASFWNYSSTPVLATLFIITYFVESNTDKAVQVLSFFVISALVSLKTYICTREPMANLIKEGIRQANAISGTYFEICDSYMKYCNNLNGSIFVFSAIGVIGYAFVVELQIYEYRKTHPGQEPTHLLIHWHPFDTTKYLKVALYIEIIRGIFFGLCNSMTQSLFNTLMIHTACQLKALKHNFKKFHLENFSAKTLVSEEKAFAQLKTCINDHQEMIIYVRKFNDTVKYMMLFEYNISSLNIATVLIQILKRTNVVFNTIYAMILIIQLLVLYCNANEIRIQSDNIHFGIYESSWYAYSKKLQQHVHIVSMRAAKPLSLTIGPFGPVIARTALGRLKLAYSYISIMPGDNTSSNQ